MARLTVVVLNWNALDDTSACLESLRRIDRAGVEVVVVDNGSADGSDTAIERRFPEVRLHRTGENLGFVAGNNLGLELARRSGAELALLLNNDTLVAPDALHRLVEALDAEPSAAAVGPSLYFHDRPQVLWSAGGRIDWKRGDTFLIGLDEVDTGQYGTAPRRVDFLSGCALLLRVSLLDRIGPLDPRFFIYYEEVEWCLRARRAGFDLLHVPRARIWHKVTAEARQTSPPTLYYMTRNRLLFLDIAGAGAAPRARALLESARTVASWTLRPRWRERRALRIVILRAISDYFRGRFGRWASGDRAASRRRASSSQ